VRLFARLFEQLDGTTSTNAKVEAMASYFREAPPHDAAWALFFLSGRRFKRLLGASLLAQWACEEARIPGWLFDESFAAVGDLAETVALLLPSASAGTRDVPLAEWVEARVLPLRGLPPQAQRDAVTAWWRETSPRQAFLVAKMLTGEMRVGVSQGLVVRALAQALGAEPQVISHRLMGTWEPSAELLCELARPEGAGDAGSKPYPFFLASPLEGEPEDLGDRAAWHAEWKWDGIRAQVVRRGGRCFIWSRGEELVTDRFPEIERAAALLPDGTVIDGEIMAWRGDGPLPFAVLQRRIGRKVLGPKILADAPAALVAYDVLEHEGADVRARPLHERRAILEELIARAAPVLRPSPVVQAPAWDALRELRRGSRERGVEGLMLKRLESPYAVGRRRGDWWKWKIDPFSIDAVLVYAQAGHGRRSSLYTDYTFAVWDGGSLRPIAKAYSGLSDAEILELDSWIRRHVRERFGPVRSVDPVHVFELHFEGLAASPRHASGIAVRFPRIARWRRDKPAAEADTLDAVKALLETAKGAPQNPVARDGFDGEGSGPLS
jgi:DNA ligase-1